VANINKHILLEIKDELIGKIKMGGRIILSGLLITDEDDILKSYLQTGLKLIGHKRMDEWAALVLLK